ncbi:MAG: tripartite tricarboxylate transporter TctB family protein [Pseudomonadota bacterium]
MSDRILGVVLAVVALAFIASATQIQLGFLSDPLGPKAFPILVGSVAFICAVTMIIQPDEEPKWPGLFILFKLAFAVAILFGYAYSLKPLGFLIPTALAAGLLSYQIASRPIASVVTGIGLSLGLFAIFKFALGLGLSPFPAAFG